MRFDPFNFLSQMVYRLRLDTRRAAISGASADRT